MITAEFSALTKSTKAGNKTVLTLKMNGHAGMADKGKDLVCASASILAYTLAQTINFMWQEKKLKKRPHIKLAPGCAEIFAEPKDTYYDECLHAFFVVQVGFHLLSTNYKEFVKLTPFGAE